MFRLTLIYRFVMATLLFSSAGALLSVMVSRMQNGQEPGFYELAFAFGLSVVMGQLYMSSLIREWRRVKAEQPFFRK